MAPIAEPRAELAPLPKADGSATYSYSGYTVTGAVNGPIEAQRRDENPFEALIDVNVRPAAGVGGKKLDTNALAGIFISVVQVLSKLTRASGGIQARRRGCSSRSCSERCGSSSPSETFRAP